MHQGQIILTSCQTYVSLKKNHIKHERKNAAHTQGLKFGPTLFPKKEYHAEIMISCEFIDGIDLYITHIWCAGEKISDNMKHVG